MGYRRGGAPRVRAETDQDERGAGASATTVPIGAGSAFGVEGAAAAGEGGCLRESPRKARRKRVWLRAVFCVFLVAEVVVAFVVEEYSPVFDFEITTVTGTGDTEAFGSNPDLLYPIKLAGSLCRPADLTACVADDAPTATLTTVCCRELRDPSSSGPEEYIPAWAAFGYVVIIPALILIVRGFLLGRVWAMKPFRESPCVKPEAIQDEGDGAWGKKRWHLRVGFYALDACLGLLAAQATTLLVTSVLKVCVGRPRPNYFALQLFSDNAANGQNFDHESVLSWPSGHTAASMAGLLFLAYVLWSDLMALVKWRRRAHPKATLILAVLGGFVVAAIPLAGFLVGITRSGSCENDYEDIGQSLTKDGAPIRDYWHRPDDVLAGLVVGMVCAHWSFRFMVLLPFSHEIGSPQWSPEPAWVEEEERKWEEEEEEFRMCPWRYRPGAPRKRVASVEAEDKAARRFPGEVLPPVRAPEADAIMGLPPV